MPSHHLRLIETTAPALSGPALPSALNGPVFRSVPTPPVPARRPLGQILLDMKAVEPANLLRALALRDRQDIRLGEILLTRGWVREADLMDALCQQWQARQVDLVAEPPDARLLDRLGPDFCLRHSVLPWRQTGNVSVFATACPDTFERMRDALPQNFGKVAMVLAPARDVHLALLRARGAALACRAETRVGAEESCRGPQGVRARRIATAGFASLALAAIAAPRATLAALSLWAILTLVATTFLKLAAGAATVRAALARRHNDPLPALPAKLPVVSMMVPLFREDDIVPRLIERLGRLDYPKELLDILLVVEEDDAATRAALARHRLPRWMRVIAVPDGPLRTKPRALNFALDFCRGSIVGVWDAEDKPAPGQITEAVRRFASAPADVACLQGILDFYDARHNWLTRCFTIDYAVWFRAVLPGLAELGLVVPLGGTTLFFRREILEKLGGWDAHNVTEDADLGLRLARHGYRTELIRTVTEEEPNSRVLAWLRQRSRWQKGYAITWASHMRSPQRLWRDLGPRRFCGVQVIFLGGLTEAILTPVLMSYWLVVIGLPHPLAGTLPAWVVAGAGILFLISEVVTLSIGLWGLSGPKHRHLIPWLPLMHFYGPLASLSSYKALWEWIVAPFYWDKTAHGVVNMAEEAAEPSVLVLTDPVWLPPSVVTPLFPNGSRRQPPAGRLHFSALPADLLPDPAALPVARPGLRLVTPARPAPYILGSTIANAPLRPGIEFQTSFEGF
ncbi:MAG TPA: glycosyltransferase [Albidovulum sp.]|uniref:glycosyltransferase n=1 Tax=Albidovulum sp. TaxID=1872424 RepID=UPI002CAEBA37|nr:glycosyltransferase [Albidovulum sp.]